MRIDDIIANYECLLSLFKNIHPNTITISGIISNFYILKFLILNKINSLNMLLIFRYFTDIMDGAVARKYNKVSKIGGYLDTIIDTMLISFYSGYFIWKITKNISSSIFLTTLIFIIIISFLFCKSSLSDHSNLKKKSTSIIDIIIKFLVNNTILAYIFIIFINNRYLKY